MLKKQHRQALMLDNMVSMDGLAAGRSLRDRKPVTYTFGKRCFWVFSEKRVLVCFVLVLLVVVVPCCCLLWLFLSFYSTLDTHVSLVFYNFSNSVMKSLCSRVKSTTGYASTRSCHHFYFQVEDVKFNSRGRV